MVFFLCQATFWTSSTFYETTLVLLELYFFFFLILNTKSSVAVSHNISQKCFLSLTSGKVFEQYYLWRKQSGFIFSCAIVASVIPPPRSDLYIDKQCNFVSIRLYLMLAYNRAHCKDRCIFESVKVLLIKFRWNLNLSGKPFLNNPLGYPNKEGTHSFFLSFCCVNQSNTFYDQAVA